MRLRHRLKWLLTKMHWLPTLVFLRWAFWLETGKRLNLDNPVTINEKLNWLKLHGRDYWDRLHPDTPQIVSLADKHAVREFVAAIIGEQYLVPPLGVYDCPEDIPWNDLPDNIIIKCTHGSHCHIIVHDLLALDIDAAVKKLRRWMRMDWYWYGREPPYRHIKPRIIIQKLFSGDTPPIDYKIMCFGGEPKIVQVHRKRGGTCTADFFTPSGDRLNMRKVGCRNSDVHTVDGRKLADMLPIARKLAQATGAPYVRVDLYHEHGQVWFGELTFFDSAGFREFEPEYVNRYLGDMIKL